MICLALIWLYVYYQGFPIIIGQENAQKILVEYMLCDLFWVPDLGVQRKVRIVWAGVLRENLWRTCRL